MATIERARVVVTCPGRNFVTLVIETSDGVRGVGDATLNGRELAVASYLQDHVRALLGLEGVFPPRLASDPRFVTLVADHLDDLRRLGAKATVESFVEVCI